MLKAMTHPILVFAVTAAICTVVTCGSATAQAHTTKNPIVGAIGDLESTVSEGSKELFTRVITVDMQGGSGSCNRTDLIQVPDGKRMVITYVSGFAYFKAPSKLVAVYLASLDIPAEFSVRVPAMSEPDASGANFFGMAGQSMHVYWDYDLRACASATAPVAARAVTINILGYFVDRD